MMCRELVVADENGKVHMYANIMGFDEEKCIWLDCYWKIGHVCISRTYTIYYVISHVYLDMCFDGSCFVCSRKETI